MPYKIQRDDGRYCVHKENADGSIGETVACHDSEDQAKQHMAALYANVEDAKSVTMTPVTDWQTGEFDGTKAGRRMQGGMLEKAKAALATFAELVKWAAYDDGEDATEGEDESEDEPMKAVEFVTVGPAVKALGGGKVGGYLVMFGDVKTPDLTGDYFTPDTDFDLEDGLGKSTVLYHHGQDATLKRRKLGRAVVGVDDVGVWIEAQLKLRDEYERAIYGLAEAGKMGWSSGTAPHLVEREAQAGGVSKITRWPLGLDASITPIPAEPRIRTMPLKSYLDTAEPYVKALLPQVTQEAITADATQATPTGATKAATEPDTNMEIIMDEQMQTLIAQVAEKAAADAIKAYEEKQPPVNPGGFATKPAEVKSQPEGFKSFGEQLDAVRRAMTPGYSIDRRLTEQKAISGMSETVTEDGGYLVQTDFTNRLLADTYAASVLARETEKLGLGPNSNGTVLNMVNETSRATGSRWGGIQVYWREEAGTVTNKQPSFRRMKLELNSLMGLCYVTDELLADAVGLGNFVQLAFADEFAFVVDDAIIRGSGNGQPLGILNSNAYVSVAKEAGQLADTIYYENVLKMWSRLWSKSRTKANWYIHQDVLPQLSTMAQVIGVGGVPVYLPATGAAGQPYSTLFGRPVIEIEQADTVGDQGDIMLLDMKQYLMAEKGGMESATSIHVRFIYAENTFRFMLRTDGQPMWNSPKTLYNSSTTVSPFVLLDARA